MELTEVLLSQKFLPEHGGSIRWMYEVYRRWPRAVEVVTHDYYGHPPGTPEMPTVPAPPGGRADHVSDANLKMDRRDIFINNWGLDRPGRVLRYARMTAAVHERLKRGGVVRVHCTHAVPEAASLLPLKWLYGKRLRVVCYAHGEEVTACRSSRQLKFIMMRGHSVVDRMIANSEYTRGVIADLIEPGKISVINPGVEFGEFVDAPAMGRAWRAERGLEGKLIVLTIGRLDPRKNHMAVLEAVGRLAGRFPNLIYVLAGQGRQMEALRTRAAALGIGERVIFTGTVDGRLKLALYGGCDVFAMPAIRDGTDVEGFGMVFLEASACGKPCIAGKEGGQPDAVKEGQTGLVVDGTDGAAVTGALERLLGDEGLRRRLGEAGRVYAAEFDWPRVVQRTLELVDNQA